MVSVACPDSLLLHARGQRKHTAIRWSERRRISMTCPSHREGRSFDKDAYQLVRLTPQALMPTHDWLQVVREVLNHRVLP